MRHAVLHATLGLILVVSAAAGETAAATPTLVVHGGVAAFRCGAGLPATLPRARVLMELARRDAALPRENTEAQLAGRFVAWLSELRTRLRAAGSERGVTPRASTRGERRALSDVMDWLGFDMSVKAGRIDLEERSDKTAAERLAFSRCLGVQFTDVAEALKTLKPISLVPPDETAPSPIDASVWQWLLGLRDAQGADILAGLINDHRALLFYYALSGLDPETLAWLVNQSDVLRWLFRERAPEMAAFGHALRIRNGAVEVPGGREAVRAWQRIVDRDVSRPGEFVRALFSRDDAKSADFLATLSALPLDAQRQLTASESFGRLYDAFVSASEPWKPHLQPFSRPLSDPAFVLLMLLGDGTPVDAGPSWRRLWEAGFEAPSISTRENNLARTYGRGDRADLAWLLSAICQNDDVAAGRLLLARFARRVFPNVKTEDVGHVAVTLAAFDRLSGLMLELERIGLRDPATYSRVAERALQLTEKDPENGAAALVAWQAALAVVSASAISGAIPRAHAFTLIDDLVRLETGRDDQWEGAIARFIRDRVFPAARIQAVAGSEPREAEDALLLALSRSGQATDDAFEWEGLTYRASVTEARGGRARAMARAQPRATLDDVLALATAAEALNAGKTAADIKAALAPLDGIEERLPKHVPWLFVTKHDPLVPRAILEGPLRAARRITRDKDASKARRTARALAWTADQLMADTLPAVLYAARLGVGVGRPESVAGVWTRHEFGFRVSEKPDPFMAWRVTAVGVAPDGGWQLRGALTGMDVAMGESWLRRVGGGPIPSAGKLSDANRQALFRTLAIRLVQPAMEVAPEWPATANVSSAALEPGGHRRRRVLDWIAEEEPAKLFSTLAWRDVAAVSHGSTEWGMSPSDAACFCTEVPWTASPDAVLGRPAAGTMFSLVPDLNFRVGTLARRIGLPPVLIPLVLAAAYQDLIDGAELAHADDWMSMAAHMNALTQERFEEYVFALIGTRDLTPAGRLP